MAKTKGELLKDAQTRGMVPDGALEDDYSSAELQAMLDPEPAAWKGSMSSKVPLVAPDGHVSLSQEDIDARDR